LALEFVDGLLIRRTKIDGEPRVGRFCVYNLSASEHANVDIHFGILWQREVVDSLDGARGRQSRGIGRRARSRVSTRTNEMELVPIDADSSVVQSLEAAVQRDIRADVILVLIDVGFRSAKRCFLFDSEDEHQV